MIDLKCDANLRNKYLYFIECNYV